MAKKIESYQFEGEVGLEDKNDTAPRSPEDTPTVMTKLEDQEILYPPKEELKKARKELDKKFARGSENGKRDFEDVDLYILDDWSLDRKSQQELQEEIVSLQDSFEGFKHMLAEQGTLDEIVAHVKENTFLSHDLLYSANTFIKFEKKITAYKKALAAKVEDLRQIYREKKESLPTKKSVNLVDKIKGFLGF